MTKSQGPCQVRRDFDMGSNPYQVTKAYASQRQEGGSCQEERTDENSYDVIEMIFTDHIFAEITIVGNTYF